jgi:hypothetical protein
MTPPVGQSCNNCSFYIDGDCHRILPVMLAGSSARWPSCEPTQWCPFWNIWPSNSGNSSVVGAAISSGQVATAGGADGDYYVKYTADPVVGITALSIYQRQAGNWVVIQTIL